MGEVPISVFTTGNITTKTGIENNQLDNTTTLFKFKSGTIATLINSRIDSFYDQRIEFMGEKKSLCVNNKGYLLLKNKKGTINTFITGITKLI